MGPFLQLYQADVVSVRHGFDRLLFRSILWTICFPGGLEKFLADQRVLRKEFGPFAKRLSETVKQHAEAPAKQRDPSMNQRLATAATACHKAGSLKLC